jgi:cytochrome c1
VSRRGWQLLAALAIAVTAGCSGSESAPRASGNVAAGRAAIERYQCGACHVIPGVADARGTVGPPLIRYGRRVYLAGKFPQDPQLLARWIRNAPSMDPATAMPATGVTEGEARDIAAYLSRLR